MMIPRLIGKTLLIDVSLSLVGEAKETTIIDGANISNVVNLSADDVTIMGFTIRNGNNSGIYLTSNNNKISENIITNNLNGIKVHYENLSTAIPPIVGHNTITNNRIINGGIFALSGWNNTVQGNFISQSERDYHRGCNELEYLKYNTITVMLLVFFGNLGLTIDITPWCIAIVFPRTATVYGHFTTSADTDPSK